MHPVLRSQISPPQADTGLLLRTTATRDRHVDDRRQRVGEAVPPGRAGTVGGRASPCGIDRGTQPYTIGVFAVETEIHPRSQPLPPAGAYPGMDGRPRQPNSTACSEVITPSCRRRTCRIHFSRWSTAPSTPHRRTRFRTFVSLCSARRDRFLRKTRSSSSACSPGARRIPRRGRTPRCSAKPGPGARGRAAPGRSPAPSAAAS